MKNKLPTLKESITYIESCGWKHTRTGHWFWIFENKNAPLHCRVLTFNLTELRHAVNYGF